MLDTATERQHLKNSLLVPSLIVSVLALLHLIPLDYCYGIEPRNPVKIYGIFLSPLLHSNWEHLWSNIGPLYIFLSGLYYYLSNKFFRILLISTVITNIVVWVWARDGCHIGSSGVVYFLAAFLLTLSIAKKDRTLGAFALIIIFLYGSMVWGVLPLKEQTSWESHATGAITGIIYGFIFRKSAIRTQMENAEIQGSEPQNEILSSQKEADNASQDISTTKFSHKQRIENWHNYNCIEYSYKTENK